MCALLLFSIACCLLLVALHTLVELRSGSSFDVNGRVRRSAEPRAFFEFEQRRSTTYSVLNSGCASMLRASPLAEVPLVVKFKLRQACCQLPGKVLALM